MLGNIKVCSICESSCTPEHKYTIGNKDYYVCDLHWNIINKIIEEHQSSKNTVTKSTTASKKPLKGSKSNAKAKTTSG
jgi:hypothetical protein